MLDRDIIRLNNIMRRLTSPHGGEAEAAFKSFQLTMERLELHPNDLELVLIDSRNPSADEFASLVADLRAELDRQRVANDALLRENVELREAVAPDVVREVQKRCRASDWPEFEELVGTRVFGGRLPKQWMQKIAERLDVTQEMVNRWRRGTAFIPADIMRELRELPGPESDIVLKKPADGGIPREKLMSVMEMLFAGKSAAEIATELELTEVQMKNFRNAWQAKPPLDAIIPVSTEGPTNWMELWMMATDLLGERGWKVKVFSRLGADPVEFGRDPNEVIDPRRLQEFRQEYLEKGRWPLFMKTAQELMAEGAKQLSWTRVSSVAREKYGFQATNNYSTFFTNRFNQEIAPIMKVNKKITMTAMPKQAGMAPQDGS